MMKIRFSEHITQSHRKGILGEIEEMGATPEQSNEDEYLVTVLKSASYSFVVEFLRKEQQLGNLEVDDNLL